MKKPMMYSYYAVLSFYDGGVSVTFPDLPGCVSHGETELDAIRGAKECLALHMYGMECDGEEPPAPSGAASIEHGEGEAVILVEAMMEPMRKRAENKYVKKTLTIPLWLNDAAMEQGVNFSQTLQEALLSRVQL